MFLIIFLGFFNEFKDVNFSNTTTLITTLFIIVHLIAICISLYNQAMVIRINNSAKCVPAEYVIAMLAGATLAIAYGLVKFLLITIISGVVRSIAVLILLYFVQKAMPMNRRQYLLFVASIVVAVVGLVPDITEILFALVLSCMFVLVAMVPRDMLYRGSRGDVSLLSQLISLIGQIAWIIYGVIISQPFVYISYSAFLFLSVLIVFLWFKFPKRDLYDPNTKIFQSMWCNFWHYKSWVIKNHAEIIENELKQKNIWKKHLTCIKCEREFYQLGKCLPAANI